MKKSFEDTRKELLRLWANNHKKFQHPSPLWKCQKFFFLIIKLSFKVDEDINLTKVTHAGMTQDDLKLAKSECV